MTIRVVVTLAGGCVQAICSDQPGVDVIVKDYDTENCSADSKLVQDSEGESYYPIWQGVCNEPGFVADTFAQVSGQPRQEATPPADTPQVAAMRRAIRDACALAQQHDPKTGLHKPIDAAELLSILWGPGGVQP